MNDFLESGAIMSLSFDTLMIAWGKPKEFRGDLVDLKKPSFYFPDFFLSSPTPWRQYPFWKIISNKEFSSLLNLSKKRFDDDWFVCNQEVFRWSFEELQKQIKSGVLKKGVPYLFATSKSLMTKERLEHSLASALSNLHHNRNIYGHWNQGRGLLGLTPELLFSHSQKNTRTVQTMALAGTCPDSQSIDEFLQDTKQIYEHEVVVSGIVEALQGEGSVTIGKRGLLQMPGITHLLTPIEITLDQPFHYEKMVEVLHPTPALGAFPKAAGRGWLEHFEKHTPRGFFGAPVGFQDPASGISKSFVAIRNVQWSDQGLKVGAGCGVVEKSVCENEWQEIQHKVRITQKQLGL